PKLAWIWTSQKVQFMDTSCTIAKHAVDENARARGGGSRPGCGPLAVALSGDSSRNLGWSTATRDTRAGDARPRPALWRVSWNRGHRVRTTHRRGLSRRPRGRWHLH